MGETSVTLTVDDGELQAQDVVVVHIVDTTPPEMTCPADITLPANDSCLATIDLKATASDICYDVDPMMSSDKLSHYPLGETTVTFAAVDSSANSASCQTKVTVVDMTPPMLSMNYPTDITVNNDPESNGAVVTWEPRVFSDNCNVKEVISTHNPGDFFPAECAEDAQGTLIIYTAEDDNGNVATHSFKVTVHDKEPPVIINCPDNIRIKSDPGSNGAVVNWTEPSCRDNCNIKNISSTHNPGDFFPAESPGNAQGTLVTYTATDACGYTTTCRFRVIVEENRKPIITINSPEVRTYFNTEGTIDIDYTIDHISLTGLATDVILDDKSCSDPINIRDLTYGSHTLEIVCTDQYGSTGDASVVFEVQPEPMSLKTNWLYVFWHNDYLALNKSWITPYKDRLFVTGFLEIPEPFTMSDLELEITVQAEIGNVLGIDTVSRCNGRGPYWSDNNRYWFYTKWFDQESDNGINLEVTDFRIVWQKRNKAFFFLCTELSNMENDDTSVVTLNLIVPVQGYGSLSGAQTVTCSFHLNKTQWYYNSRML